MCAEIKGISKGQVIGWTIPIVVSIIGIIFTLYINHETRLRVAENEIKILNFEINDDRKDIDNIMSDLKDIKTTVIGIDKKIDIDEIKWGHNKK